MKTETFTGATREEAERKVEQWRSTHRSAAEKNYVLSESGSPAGRFAPKAARKNELVSISISYEESK